VFHEIRVCTPRRHKNSSIKKKNAWLDDVFGILLAKCVNNGIHFDEQQAIEGKGICLRMACLARAVLGFMFSPFRGDAG